MAETNPAGGSPTIDVAAITKSAADAVLAAPKPVTDQIGELARNQKVLGDTLVEQGKLLATPKPAEGAAGKDLKDAAAKPLTLDDVMKTVSEAIKKDREAAQQTQQQSAARDKFIGERMKNLPAAYHAKLGNDPAKFESEAAAIANEFKADAERLGLKPKNIGGDNPGGASPVQQPGDESKMSGMQLLDSAVAETGRRVVSAGEQTVEIKEVKA